MLPHKLLLPQSLLNHIPSQPPRLLTASFNNTDPVSPHPNMKLIHDLHTQRKEHLMHNRQPKACPLTAHAPPTAISPATRFFSNRAATPSFRCRAITLSTNGPSILSWNSFTEPGMTRA